MSTNPTGDLLSEWTATACTRDGEPFTLRPLRADDRVRETAFDNSLSQRTRYLRLHAHLKSLPPHLLDSLMDVDYHGRMAFVAAVERNGVEEFVGIARYGESDQPTCADLAVVVSDAWQSRGVARVLLDHLVRYAVWRGFVRLCGVVLPENAGGLALARNLGFDVSRNAADGLMRICRTLQSQAAHGYCLLSSEETASASCAASS